MYRRFFCWFIALIAAFIPSALSEERGYTEDLIRLHVVADGNFADEQALKLEVRDAVLKCAREELGMCADADEAWEALSEHAAEFETAARNVANGVEVSVELGVFAFPEREYGGVIVPAGDYRALRVVLGDGGGRNWWCVLYPALCTPATRGEDVVYYSCVIEWLEELFGGGE